MSIGGRSPTSPRRTSTGSWTSTSRAPSSSPRRCAAAGRRWRDRQPLHRAGALHEPAARRLRRGQGRRRGAHPLPGGRARARGIRVNTIAPGAVATDFSGGIVRDTPALQEHLSALTALGRVAVADDIGAAIAALLGDGNRWVTGQRIEVSGGIHLSSKPVDVQYVEPLRERPLGEAAVLGDEQIAPAIGGLGDDRVGDVPAAVRFGGVRRRDELRGTVRSSLRRRGSETAATGTLHRRGEEREAAFTERAIPLRTRPGRRRAGRRPSCRSSPGARERRLSYRARHTRRSRGSGRPGHRGACAAVSMGSLDWPSSLA